MAVFTAIATAIVGAIGITGVLATIATSVIAGGLAYGTARALGVFKAPEINTKDPGVTIQLPPATDNKLPILYGQAFTSGPIFDAAISNENKTMTYCIALSEETQTGDFTCSQVFMNDVELIFTGNTVTSHRDPNQSSDTNYSGKIRLNIYQGGSAGANVIFPTSGTGSSTAATSIVPHWGVNHTANAMVFAVLQIDYDAENGLSGLPQMTFKMNNTLNNPGDVLNDFLTSSRYGAGLSNTDIDSTSITAMVDHCDDLVTYTNKSNVSTTNKRYQINGMLSTFDVCSTNIDKICQAAATYFTFNPKDGKFKVIPNREATTAEKNAALVYDENRIIGKVDIGSTELYNLYNGVEIEFADQNRKDQTNTVLVETPAGDRNTNEPDNVLKYSIDVINDNIRAERLANIDLAQSRNSMVLQFETDFTGIQSDVGDIIKVHLNLYEFDDKLFRVMRVEELTGEGGMVTARITALEYDDSFYGNPAITETPDIGFIDLPRIPIIPPIYIPPIYAGTYGNVAALPGVYGNALVNQTMAIFGAGAQLENAGLFNSSIANGTVYHDLITPEVYDVTGVDLGDYTFSAVGDSGGVIESGGYDLAFRNNVTVQFGNATNTQDVNYGGGGVAISNAVGLTPQLADLKKVSFDPLSPTNVAAGVAPDMLPEQATVRLQGYSTLGEDVANSIPRVVGNMGYEVKRITKGEK